MNLSRGIPAAGAALLLMLVFGWACSSPTRGPGTGGGVDATIRTETGSTDPGSQNQTTAEVEQPQQTEAAGSPQHVWVALEDENRLARVDVTDGRVLTKRTVAGPPHNLVVSQGGVVVAALWSNERVAIVRRGSVKHVRLGGAPHDVKIADRRILVANQGSNRLQLLSLKGRRRGEIMLHSDPHDVAIDPNGYIAWATLEGSDELARVNLKSRKVLRYVPTGKSPHDILFSPTGRLWVTDWNGAVHVFSRKGRHIKSRALGEEAHHLAFTHDGRRVWITDHETHSIYVLATRSMRLVKRLPIAGAPHHVTITRDGKKAVVADHDRGLIVVYRVARLKRIRRIQVGAGPHGVWSSP